MHKLCQLMCFAANIKTDRFFRARKQAPKKSKKLLDQRESASIIFYNFAKLADIKTGSRDGGKPTLFSCAQKGAGWPNRL